MKQAAKNLIVKVLNWQVRRLFAQRNFKVIAVVGSIGKTSTKFAIANVLQSKFRVQYQAGNYNDVVTVPLVVFGQAEPALYNPFAWLATFLRIEKQLRQDYPYDVVVLELGTDYPGNVAEFGKAVDVDIAVVTALTAEHMEFFGTLEAVAQEELSVAAFSKQLLVNADLCDKQYLGDLKPMTYGLSKADYRITDVSYDAEATSFALKRRGENFLSMKHDLVSEAQLYSVAAAAAIADACGMTPAEITESLAAVQPVAGRMQRLEGVQNSTILDDTYNASPEAARLALDTLYRIKAPQRIAILGNMNEMGEYSEKAHKEVGSYCDPKKLDLVITLGPDANQYLAAEARARGCEVVTCDSPYDAAEEVKKVLQDGALILAKGSQNRVFAEEAVKLLLAKPSDASKLVRQSDHWLRVKEKQFGKVPSWKS